MSNVIGLLGATGYTGGLTAGVLDAAGVRHLRGGRSAERLAALPRSTHAEDVVVDTTDDASLEAFLERCDVVISTVGPFQQLGRAVVEAAVRTRTPYVDSNGEPEFLKWLFAEHRDAPVPLVPSCAFDYLPGDLAVALASESLGGPDDIVDVLVGYRISHASLSRGTLQSVWGAAQVTPWRPCMVSLPLGGSQNRGGRQNHGSLFPWGEQVTVPLRSPKARVRTAIAAPLPLATALHVVAPIVEHTGGALKAWNPIVSRWTAHRPDGPDEEVRRRSEFEVVAQVRDDAGREALTRVTGTDGYGLTARWLVACAQLVGGVEPGARSTAEAFDPHAVLVSGPGISWSRTMAQAA